MSLRQWLNEKKKCKKNVAKANFADPSVRPLKGTAIKIRIDPIIFNPEYYRRKLTSRFNCQISLPFSEGDGNKDSIHRSNNF